MEIIISHLNSDFDSLASMVAASKLYPRARLVFPGSLAENLRYYLSKHPEINYLKARSIKCGQIGRLIMVDANLGGHFGPLDELLANKGLRVHIYDHHPQPACEIEPELAVIRNVGATTTIMVDILRRKGIALTEAEATLFALGIYEDTGFLTFTSTTRDDLYSVAYLLGQGADLDQVTDYIKRELSGEQVALLNELVQNAEEVLIHGVPITVAVASMESYVGEIAVLAHKLRDIEKAGVLFVLVRIEGRLQLVARSRLPEVNVGELVKPLGGGGHASAASASIKNMTMVQAREKLLRLLQEHIPPQRVAVQIMTSPVKVVSPRATLQEAKELFLRYNINNMPVVGANNDLLGIINRQLVDRGVGHGLEKAAVAEVMLTEIETVEPEADLDLIKHRMMERHQQFLPVVRENRVVGIITRTDLLRVLHEKLTPAPLLNGQYHEYPHKKNLSSLLRERLTKPVLSVLRLAGEVGDEVGFGVYVVGGMVRDVLLRENNLDLDLVVENDGILFARRLAERVGGHFRSHAKFGTAVVVFPDGFKLDVATARTEYYRHPAALPIVEQSSIKQDLYRRDFTINALAIKLNGPDFGSLIDFFGGQQDLKNGIIRVLHSLSLVEDPTRVFRAVRFEQRFGFRIGKHTLGLIKSAVKKGLCDYLDSHRLLNELSLIFRETDPYNAICRMHELGLLHFVHPGLKLKAEDLELFARLKTVADWYGLLFLPHAVNTPFLYLLAFASFLKPDEVRGLVKRMGMSPKDGQAMLKSHRRVPPVLHQLQREKSLAASRVYALLAELSLEALLLLMAKSEAAWAKKHLSLYLTKLQHKATLLSGKELRALGFAPGPLIGRIKKALLYARLDGEVKSREDELRWVKKHFPARRGAG